MKTMRFVLICCCGLLALLLVACGDDETPPATVDEGSLTPRTGGLVLAAETPPPPTATQPPNTPTPVVLSIGQTVAAEERSLRLYAAASGLAPVLEEYPAGATFTVIEPSGVYTGYPVAVEGRSWYRLRAADGLVGWAIIEGVTARAD
jgi:hypothetical protein